MLTSRCLDLINREFDDLTVKRDLDGTGERFHCQCRCGGYRTCTRRQLIARVVKSCAACAARNKHVNNGNVEPPLPPEPIAKHAPTICNGLCKWHNTELGPMLGADPDCDKHSPLYRKTVKAYPGSALPLGGGRQIHSHRKAGLGYE